jgi:hypothetical protein
MINNFKGIRHRFLALNKGEARRGLNFLKTTLPFTPPFIREGNRDKEKN